MESQQHNSELEEFKDKVEKIKTATMVTVSTTSQLRGRPMSTAQVDDEGNLWFFTNEYSGKVDEIEHHHDVLLNYNDTSADLYIVVNGRAELVDDKAKMKELWNPVLKLWFPDGLEDERLKLLKVVTQEVEYWNAGSSKIERVFKSVKSLIKGEVYRDDDHKKVTIG